MSFPRRPLFLFFGAHYVWGVGGDVLQEKIRKTTSPTLFLHGLKDEVVPHLHSLDLYKASIATQKVCTFLIIMVVCGPVRVVDVR